MALINGKKLSVKPANLYDGRPHYSMLPLPLATDDAFRTNHGHFGNAWESKVDEDAVHENLMTSLEDDGNKILPDQKYHRGKKLAEFIIF